MEFTKKALVTSGMAFSLSFAPVSSDAAPLWTGSYSGECAFTSKTIISETRNHHFS
jgi:hypothetical protein